MSSKRPTVLVTIGTRPELIKLAPVIHRLRRDEDIDSRVVFTAQHRGLLDQMAAFFHIEPDVDLDVMRAAQGLSALTGRLLRGLDAVLHEYEPDLVIGQGDTTTVLSTALACYHRRVRFAHLEAGLRTDNLYSPFPEEGNRRLVGQLAAMHFAPTRIAKDRLISEGVNPATIHLTGNTVVDTLLETASRENLDLPIEADTTGPLILLTVHRREHFGDALHGILRAVRILATLHPKATVLFPCHPNPAVRQVAETMLAGTDNIRIVDPLDYGQLIAVMRRSDMVMTDSGGIQEEAPSLGVPLLVLRDSTERPEGVEAGVAQLVGTNPSRILDVACQVLAKGFKRPAVLPAPNPYGDGKAAQRVVRHVRDALGLPTFSKSALSNANAPSNPQTELEFRAA